MTRVRRGNLPAELTSFVGRRAEQAQLKRSIEGHRAVTVTGTGGVGKTRLARRLAEDVAGSFADGVWLVELDDVSDGPLLPSTVLIGLGLRDDGGTPVEDRLVDHFRDKHALLLLDGCDTVVEACAELVTRLLRASPGLRVLSSSRRPLHVPGEAVVPIGPLPVPRDDQAAPDPAALVQFDAIALFAERAEAVGSVFSGAELEVAARVCRRLDGLPMAIEFAADRLDVLSLEELDDRLDDAYRVLVAGRRGAPERQRTLRALVDSSYALCSEEEQLLWARLAVFTGRFALAAVESVCADATLPKGDMLDLVAGLIDKSVLAREEHPGGTWYRLPRLLRDYAADRLTGLGERDQVRDRHLRWCLQLADQASEGLLTGRSGGWINQVRGNHANIRTALEYCLDNPSRVPDALRLATALWYYWVMAGLVAEGREWLDRGLRAVGPSTAERALALCAAAYLAMADNDDASELLASSNALEKELAEPAVTANLRLVEGLLEIHRRDLAAACASLDEARESFEATHDRMGLGRALCLLGMAWTLNGDWQRGRRYCDDFLAMPDARTENWGFAYIQWTIALIQWQHEEYADALAAQRGSAARLRKLDDRFGMGACVQSAVLHFAAAGQHREAALLAGAAESHRVPSFAVLDELRRDHTAEVRNALGAEVFAELVEQGRGLSLEEAVDIVAGSPSEAARSTVAEEPPTALSKREWEVAELVAAGKGNKQIAATLVISTRTAEGHVQRILGKLDFASRAQIAVWVTEQRALAQPGRAL